MYSFYSVNPNNCQLWYSDVLQCDYQQLNSCSMLRFYSVTPNSCQLEYFEILYEFCSSWEIILLFPLQTNCKFVFKEERASKHVLFNKYRN